MHLNRKTPAILFASFTVLLAMSLLGGCDSKSRDNVCFPECAESLCQVCHDGECVVACRDDEVCQSGICVDATPCDPACDASQCMVCSGGSCMSSCGVDETCENGTCVTTCTPDCAGKVCGDDDGCGSTCMVDSCSAGAYCSESGCTSCVADEHCGDTCIDCTASNTNMACVETAAMGVWACGCAASTDCALGEVCTNSVCEVDNSCSPACDANQCLVCDSGNCVSSCVAGEVCDNGSCVADNTCSPACDANQCLVCNSGTCESSCTTGEVCDNGTCVVDNTCNPVCDASQCLECVNGSCQSSCAIGQVCNNGTCVDDNTCSPACDASQCLVCNNGVCQSSCVTGEVCTNGTCVADNTCTPACDASQCLVCSNGVCQSSCIAGEVCENGTCVVDNTCNPACATNLCMECVNGSCLSSCVTGQVCQNGTCVADNTCSPACDSSQCMVCNNGTCESSCATGQVCQNGTCVADNTCSPACDAGQCMVCNNGTCESSCVTGQVCQNGSCVASGPITIYDIQDQTRPNSPDLGDTVTVSGVVTAIDYYYSNQGTFWIQDPMGGQYSGIAVFNSSGTPISFSEGDVVSVTGDYLEFYGLSNIALQSYTVTGTGTLPTPELLLPTDLNTAAGALAEPWEGVLVEVQNVSVTDPNPGFGQVIITDDLILDDDLVDLSFITMSTTFSTLVGIHSYGFDNYRLLPRYLGDMLPGEGCWPTCDSFTCMACVDDVCQFACSDAEVCMTGACVPAGMNSTSIYDLQNQDSVNYPGDGTDVLITGAIVTAIDTKGNNRGNFWIQEAQGGTYSGIMVYNSVNAPIGFSVGDMVTVYGTYQEYFTEAQIALVAVSYEGPGAIPSPAMIADPADIATGGSMAEMYEGVLVQVNSLTVTTTSADLGFGEVEVNNSLRFDDEFYQITPEPALNDTFVYMMGILRFNHDNTKLCPRDENDFE